ncbi:hypothetical protein T07_2467 [Trichinella nelsoni]|uniref:Uncharacterized protein n=1 Tax=Trichinella nelsoni TaxID=6336 RepID=A0A0V0RJ47_9BILA|nr:hypothetical protein T07_2467 [Trichinella nelsoni]
MSAQGVYLTPDGAGRCRDNDLADGMRVLSSSYPRLPATSPRPVWRCYLNIKCAFIGYGRKKTEVVASVCIGGSDTACTSRFV